MEQEYFPNEKEAVDRLSHAIEPNGNCSISNGFWESIKEWLYTTSHDKKLHLNNQIRPL
jgi:hypothetical protein